METLQMISTILLVLLTGYYAWQTKNMVQVMKNAESERLRPRIGIYFTPSEEDRNFCYLVVNNFGLDLAREVNFVVHNDKTIFHLEGGQVVLLCQIPIFENGIAQLPPNVPSRIHLANATTLFQSLQQSQPKILVEITYLGTSLSSAFTDSIEIDRNYFAHFDRIS